MSQINPESVVFDHVTSKGVLPVTIRNCSALKLLAVAREVVRAIDPEGWAAYRSLKYATPRPTEQQRRVAYAYLMTRASTIAVEGDLRLETQ